MRPLVASVGLALSFGCSATELAIELDFPDPGSSAASTGLVVTAVEPFASSGDDFGGKQLVKCGEISVFPPVAKYDRDGAELAGIDAVRINREYQRFPLAEDWTLDVPGLSQDSQSNPWRALLVHFEARGPAQAYDGEGLGEIADATLLEGCFCVRLSPDAVGGDALLSEQLDEHCPPLPDDGSPLVVEMRSVAPEAFRVEACGVSTLTAPRGQRLASSPAVCVRTIPCTSPGAQACFECEGSCSELDDKRNLPIKVTVEGGGDTRPVGELLLTDAAGRAVPEIDVADCNAPFTIRVGPLGRAGQTTTFEVECVSALSFDRALDVNIGTINDAVDITTVPGALDGRGGRSPAVVALMGSDTTSGLRPTAEVHLLSQQGDTLTPVVMPLRFMDETPRAVFGYHYRLGTRIEDRDRPLLAVATSKVIAGSETMVVRVYEWDGNQLTERRATTQLCDVCSCTRPRPTPELHCLGCKTDPSVPDCTMEFKVDTKVTMTWSDLDADGFADLSIGASSDFPMVTYYSAVRGVADPSRELYPPDLDASCSCSQYGKLLGTYELLRLGGPNPVVEELTYDFVVGNVTGAFALYALGNNVDGRRCDSTQNHEAQCGPGAVCEQFCGNSAGRCVTPCDKDFPVCEASPLQPTCTSTAHETEAKSYFCGGPRLRCDQPASIWKLVNVQYLTKGTFTDSGFEDVVAIGSTSPAPGADDRGLLRIIYGDRINLTRIDDEPMDIRNSAHFDLSPLTFAGRSPPQGPRSAEVGDFNGDGRDDLAVLYAASEEVHVWLGGGNRGPGEVEQGIVMAQTSADRCFPEDRFTVGDYDRDGRDEIVVVCRTDTGPRIRRWVPIIQ